MSRLHDTCLTVDSVRAFKKRMKLGQFAEKDEAAIAEEKEQKEEEERKEAEAIPVGSRCEVAMPGAMTKRGTVMFVGKHCLSTISQQIG